MQKFLTYFENRKPPTDCSGAAHTVSVVVGLWQPRLLDRHVVHRSAGKPAKSTERPNGGKYLLVFKGVDDGQGCGENEVDGVESDHDLHRFSFRMLCRTCTV